jgi:hypothetical protein
MLNTKIIIFNLLILISLNFCAAGNFVIVQNGNPGKFIIEAGDKWKREASYIEGGGTNTRLGCKKLFAGKDFIVKAELALTKLARTAASFQINESHFGFDGRGKDGPQLFVEGEDLSDFPIKLGPSPLQAGKKFKFLVKCNNRILSFFINDKLIKQIKLKKKTKRLSFCFRPHRSNMRIYSFSISGEAAGTIQANELLGIKLSSQIYDRPLSINNDAVIELASSYAGAYFANARDAFFKCENNSTKINIPANILEAVYAKTSSRFVLRMASLLVQNKDGSIKKLLLGLYDPKTLTDFPISQIKMHKRTPYIFINGKWQGMLEGIAANLPHSTRFSGESIKKFADIGLNLFPVSVSPKRFMSSDIPFDANEVIDKTVNFISKMIMRINAEAPQNHVILFWDLEMPSYWGECYPDELIKLGNGGQSISNTPEKKLQPSYASKIWQKQAGKIIQNVLIRLRNSAIADHICGVRLCYGNCGEWNHWGYHQRTFVDFSKPMQRAFGKWLKGKYKTLKRFRIAWTRNDIDFQSNNLVPNAKMRLGNSNSLLRKLPQAQAVVDYYQFFQYFTVNTIEYFAKIVKKSSDKRLLAGAYYGYYLNHLGINYHFQDSGHYALKHYLKSPFLDFLGGPYTYQDRLENAPLNGVFSSISLHNKLWITEHDQRTHRSKGKRHKMLGATENVSESVAVLKRDFMNNLSKGTSFYFYDFIKKWYIDREYLEVLSVLRKISHSKYNNGVGNKVQVAVFVSEESIPYISSSTHSGMRTLANMLMFEMDKAGAPWAMFLLSDLEKVDLKQFKMIILPDSFYISAKNKLLIKEKLCSNRRNIVWLYAPALLDNRGRINPGHSAKITKVLIKYKENIAVSNLIPQNLRGVYESLLTPNTFFMTYIVGAKNNVFGRFPGFNMAPGAVEKKLKKWNSYVICFPGLDREWLRALYKRCGVHVWNRGDYGVFHVAGNFISLYSRKGGNKKIVLPKKVEIVYDIFSKKVISRNTKIVKFNMLPKIDTRIIFIGSQQELAKFNSIKRK